MIKSNWQYVSSIKLIKHSVIQELKLEFSIVYVSHAKLGINRITHCACEHVQCNDAVCQSIRLQSVRSTVSSWLHHLHACTPQQKAADLIIRLCLYQLVGMVTCRQQ